MLCRSLDLTGPLLLGGVPTLPESFPIRSRHFVGCMRHLHIDQRPVDMAAFIANNGTLPGGHRGWETGQRLGWLCSFKQREMRCMVKGYPSSGAVSPECGERVPGSWGWMGVQGHGGRAFCVPWL